MVGIYADNIVNQKKVQGSGTAVIHLDAGEKLDYFSIDARKIAEVSGRARNKPALSATKQAQCLKFRLDVSSE